MGQFGGPEEMEITLNNGFQMPIIGLGVWRMEKNEMRDLIINAIKIGYRHFDCAGNLHSSLVSYCTICATFLLCFQLLIVITLYSSSKV